MANPMRLIRRLFIILLAVLVIVPAAAAFLVFEQEAAVPEMAVISSKDLVRGRKLAMRTRRQIMRTRKGATVSASEDDLNGLMAIAHHSLAFLKGRADIKPQQVETRFTLSIPHNPIGSYINIHLAISPADGGFAISHSSIGRLVLPGKITKKILGLSLDIAMGNKSGQYLINSVKSITIDNRYVTVNMLPMPDLWKRLHDAQNRLKEIRNEMGLLGDPLDITGYYQFLLDLSASLPHDKTASLSGYLGPLFQKVREKGGKRHDQNKAALLALGIYFGHRSIEQLTGPVRTPEMKRIKPRTRNVVLAGRHDLRQHFLVSAALKILADSGVSYAIGEMKELLDAGKGGSGFSFADLAADRAGVRFAEQAISPASASDFQEFFAAAPSEEFFFPQVSSLPEGLSDSQFRQIFGNLESFRFNELEKAIDQCIDRLPAYSGDRFESAAGCDAWAAVSPELRQVIEKYQQLGTR